MTTAAAPPFIAIGENIHATRVVLRKGRRVAVRAGAVAVLYRAADGAERALPVPEAAKKTKDYEEGRVKHVQIAIETAMETGDPAEGRRYIEALVRHQERAGAAFLDLNVDEMSPKLEVQTAAMAWLARTVQGMAALPLSIDSSSIDVIRAGLEALAPGGAQAMLNSASLERLDALALARAHGCRVVVTAAGEKGMPDGAEERVANAARMIEAAGGAGFAEGDVYVDPLVFPVSVDGRYGRHCLDAIRALRRDPHHRRHQQRLVRPAGPQAPERGLRPARGRGRRRRRHHGPGREPAGRPLRPRPHRPAPPPGRGRHPGPRRTLHGLDTRLAKGETCRRVTPRSEDIRGN